MAFGKWLAACACVGLSVNACGGDSAGLSEVRALDANTGKLLWTKRLAAETSGVYGVGCASRADLQATCRDGVAVVRTFDDCSAVHSVAVEPESGQELQSTNEPLAPLFGDQRTDPVWQAGATVCRELGAGDPYFTSIAPLVDGVCVFYCAGPKTTQSDPTECTLAAVDATTGDELWRREVGAFNRLTVRGSLLLALRDNDDASAASKPYALSRIDVQSGNELWRVTSTQRLIWAGVHGEQVLLANSERLLSVAMLDGSVSFDVPNTGAPAGVLGDVKFFTETLQRSECPAD